MFILLRRSPRAPVVRQRRRSGQVFPRGPDGAPLAEPLVVSIDVSEIAFTETSAERLERRIA
jgi:hypothetical protein